MNQYLLTTIDERLHYTNEQKDPTKVGTAIVYAESETKARAFVTHYAGTELQIQPDAWTNPTFSKCTLIKSDVKIPREQLAVLEYCSDIPLIRAANDNQLAIN